MFLGFLGGKFFRAWYKNLHSGKSLPILNLIAAASPVFSSGIKRKEGLTLIEAQALLFKKINIKKLRKFSLILFNSLMLKNKKPAKLQA